MILIAGICTRELTPRKSAPPVIMQRHILSFLAKTGNRLHVKLIKVKRMKKWKCSVCNYIHEGDEPPTECPVCGADKDKFIEVREGSTQPANEMEVETPVDNPSTMFEKITALILDKHLHPISVHGPNGIIPMAVIFFALAALLQLPSFGSAAYLSMIFVLLSMPPVLLTGYLTWQKKYKGAKTSVFKMKIAASCVATVILFGLIICKTVRPDVLSNASLDRFIFLFWSVVMLAAIGIAGHLGGQLVFGGKK